MFSSLTGKRNSPVPSPYIESLPREYYADVIERFYWVALPLTTQKFPFTIPAG